MYLRMFTRKINKRNGKGKYILLLTKLNGVNTCSNLKSFLYNILYVNNIFKQITIFIPEQTNNKIIL